MKTPRATAIHWCPFCKKSAYRNPGNLANHIEGSHTPQKCYSCLDCGGSWNLPLGRARHQRKPNCSGQRFQTSHHKDKRALYACGICTAVFDDFGLHQDHLVCHQLSGCLKRDWSKDNVMRGLHFHVSISRHWSAAYADSFPAVDIATLSWDWADRRITDAIDALECNRFSDLSELRGLLDLVLRISKGSKPHQQNVSDFDILDFNDGAINWSFE